MLASGPLVPDPVRDVDEPFAFHVFPDAGRCARRGLCRACLGTGTRPVAGFAGRAGSRCGPAATPWRAATVADRQLAAPIPGREIGRASCRERMCSYV